MTLPALFRSPARTLCALVLGASLIMGVAACGGATSAVSTPADTIVIRNFGFQPAELRVAPGATVTVHNEDGSTHTVSADGGQFETANIGPGQTVAFKAPSVAGHYSYHCAIHQFMQGTLTVSG